MELRKNRYSHARVRLKQPINFGRLLLVQFLFLKEGIACLAENFCFLAVLYLCDSIQLSYNPLIFAASLNLILDRFVKS